MATNYVHNPLEGDKPELIIDLEQAVGDLVSIIVVHKDRPAYLNLCLQSLAICSQNASHEIIVVDNNSGPETQEFLIDIQKIYFGPMLLQQEYVMLIQDQNII